MKNKNVNIEKNGSFINENSMKYQIQVFEENYPKTIKSFTNDMVGELSILQNLEEAKEGVEYLMKKVKDKNVNESLTGLYRLLDRAVEIAYSTC